MACEINLENGATGANNIMWRMASGQLRNFLKVNTAVRGSIGRKPQIEFWSEQLVDPLSSSEWNKGRCTYLCVVSSNNEGIATLAYKEIGIIYI